MSFAELRVYFNGLRVKVNGLVKVTLDCIEIPQLEVCLVISGISCHRICKQTLYLLHVLRALHSFLALPDGHRIIVVRARISGLLLYKPHELRLNASQWDRSGHVNLAQENVGSRLHW